MIWASITHTECCCSFASSCFKGNLCRNSGSVIKVDLMCSDLSSEIRQISLMLEWKLQDIENPEIKEIMVQMSLLEKQKAEVI